MSLERYDFQPFWYSACCDENGSRRLAFAVPRAAALFAPKPSARVNDVAFAPSGTWPAWAMLPGPADAYVGVRVWFVRSVVAPSEVPT